MQILITTNAAKLAEVQELLRDVPNGLARALAGAVNDTAKHVKSKISSDIRERIKLYRRPSAAADIVDLVLGDERLARERAS